MRNTDPIPSAGRRQIALILLAALLLMPAVLPRAALAQTGDDVFHLGIERSSVPRVRLRLELLPGENVSPRTTAGLARMATDLARDLHYSGLIDLVSPLPEGVGSPRGSQRDPRLEESAETPAFAVALALSGERPDSMVWEAYLNEPDGAMAMGLRYTVNLVDPSAAVHHFADAVVKQLAGEAGIAQTRILFSRGGGEQRELFVVDYDGENLHEVTRNGRLNLMPRWSPRGERISFTTYHGGRQRLMLLETATGRSRQIADFPGLNVGAEWSPEGDALALTLSRDGNSEIYLVDTEGSILQRLTFENTIDCSPVWDPGGRQIAYTSDRTGSPQIYVMDRVGTGRRRVTFEGSYNDSAAWSPLGDRIAYVSRVDGRFTIFTVAPDGSDLQRITYPGDGDNEDPSWAPDGRHLVVSSNRTGYTNLWVIDVGTGEARQLTRGQIQDRGPCWGSPPATTE